MLSTGSEIQLRNEWHTWSEHILRQRCLPPQLFGFECLIDGFLSSIGSVLSSSTALHDPRALHLLVPRAGQNIVRFPIFISHHPCDLQREHCMRRKRKQKWIREGQNGHKQGDEWKRKKKLAHLHSGKKKWVEWLLTHLSGHVSGEVAVRGKFEMAAVACSVVHNVYFSWLRPKKHSLSIQPNVVL